MSNIHQVKNSSLTTGVSVAQLIGDCNWKQDTSPHESSNPIDDITEDKQGQEHKDTSQDQERHTRIQVKTHTRIQVKTRNDDRQETRQGIGVNIEEIQEQR